MWCWMWWTGKCFSNSHDRAGQGALLGLALSDEEGAFSFAFQEILRLCAIDAPNVPGALVVMCLIVIIIQQRIEAESSWMEWLLNFSIFDVPVKNIMILFH